MAAWVGSDPATSVKLVVGPVQRVDVEDGNPFCWLSDSGAFFRAENGGVLADMGVHYLDLVQDLLGPLTPVAYRDDWRGGCEANCTYELTTGAGRKVSNPRQAIAIGLHEASASKYASRDENRKNFQRTKRRERQGATARSANEGFSATEPTRSELYEEAKKRKIPRRSKTDKDQLRRALQYA